MNNSLGTLTDGHGRTITYLRLSITDRCNLRCRYCFPQQHFTFLPHQSILTYEELMRIVEISRSLNITKLRLTGGEPFIRKDFLGFLEKLRTRHGDLDLRLTTNGTLVPGKVRALKDIGVTCINLSLDTLDRPKFEAITGRDFLPRVRQAMDEILDAGLRLKVNAVALKGVNDDELGDFLQLAIDHPVDIRLIEYMPIGGKCVWNRDNFWPAREILDQARQTAELEPLAQDKGSSGPARMFSLKGGKGRFGLITPMSSHFCGTCNRLRITANGRLRTCLFSDKEYRIRPLLRCPKIGDDQILKVFTRATRNKPIGTELLKQAQHRGHSIQKRMSAIGG